MTDEQETSNSGYTDEQVIQIAEACHESNRAWCEQEGLTVAEPWEDLHLDQQSSVINGVFTVLDRPDISPGNMHAAWCEAKIAAGWTFAMAPTDYEAKTHANLVDYDALPEAERYKDISFIQTVRNFKDAIDNPTETINEVAPEQDDAAEDDEPPTEFTAPNGRVFESAADVMPMAGACYEEVRSLGPAEGADPLPPWDDAPEEVKQQVTLNVVEIITDPARMPETDSPQAHTFYNKVLALSGLTAGTEVPDADADADEDNGGGSKPGLVGKTCQQSVQSSRG